MPLALVVMLVFGAVYFVGLWWDEDILVGVGAVGYGVAFGVGLWTAPV